MSDSEPIKNAFVEEAISYARQCMEEKLVPELTYHNLKHTFEHVMPAAMELAEKHGVGGTDQALLAVAVAFHDMGWIIQGKGHERISAMMARQKLPEFGFTEDQINKITDLILATQLPHRPRYLLEEILIDADMAVLSRDDFWQCHDELRAEMEVLGKPLSDVDWYRSQLTFLEDHRYFTDVAVEDREQAKREHMQELRRRLEACNPRSGRYTNGQSRSKSLVKSEKDA